jgi:fucose 4-O-acetylase-like acetyltransferase
MKSIPNSHASRLIGVDMMIGIAMTLVVLGHMSFNFTPEWYNVGLHGWIYSFHMELFIFLSALLIRYSYKGVHTIKDYFHYEWRKFSKFFFPFILVGAAVGICSAYFNGNLGHNNWWSILVQESKSLLVWPMQSHASFLWYIYVLMGFYIISPLYFKLPRWAKMALCLIAIALPMIPCSYQFGGALFCKYAFFYCLGELCAEGLDELKSLKVWHWFLASLPFIAWSIYFIITKDNSLYSIFTGFIALPAAYFLSLGLEKISWICWCMTKISKGCFWIYLFQMFISWGCAIAFRESNLITIMPFWIFMIVCMLLSISIPLCFQALSDWLAQLMKSKKKDAK